MKRIKPESQPRLYLIEKYNKFRKDVFKDCTDKELVKCIYNSDYLAWDELHTRYVQKMGYLIAKAIHHRDGGLLAADRFLRMVWEYRTEVPQKNFSDIALIAVDTFIVFFQAHGALLNLSYINGRFCLAHPIQPDSATRYSLGRLLRQTQVTFDFEIVPKGYFTEDEADTLPEPG